LRYWYSLNKHLPIVHTVGLLLVLGLERLTLPTILIVEDEPQISALVQSLI
jgi:hypothetical protein